MRLKLGIAPEFEGRLVLLQFVSRTLVSVCLRETNPKYPTVVLPRILG